jgi:hypothetical protein
MALSKAICKTKIIRKIKFILKPFQYERRVLLLDKGWTGIGGQTTNEVAGNQSYRFLGFSQSAMVW